MKIFMSTVAVGIALAGAADAATLIFSHTIAGPFLTSLQGPFTSTFTLSSFDTALGRLTGVEIVLDITTFGNFLVINDDFMPQAFNAYAAAPFAVTGPDGSIATENLTYGPISGVVRPQSDQQEVVALFGNASTSTGAFSFYESPTPRNLGFTLVAGAVKYTAIAASNVFIFGDYEPSGTVEVQYTYSPGAAPEPAAWGLMIVGFGMVGGVLRRRSATATAI